MGKDMERRYATGEKIELREASEGNGPGTIVGRAVVYNSRSKKLFGSFYEEVMPGALDASLSNTGIRALYEHDSRATLGKVGSGTLRLLPSADGIDVEIDLPNTSAGRDAAELVSRGDVSGMSFGFTNGVWDWIESETGDDLGKLKRADLLEVTLTANPAYMATSAAKRSLDESKAEQGTRTDRAHLERELRLREAEFDLL